MNNYEQNKATLIVLAAISFILIIIIVPIILNNNKKEDKENFPTYKNIEVNNKNNNNNEVKKQLEKDYNFRKEVLIDDFDYENYTSLDVQNVLWNYIFSYELSNTKYLSSISENKFCLRNQYVIDSFKELYNIDISKDLDLLPGYYKYVTNDKRRYCFNYKNVSLEYNNDIRIGIDNISIDDDIITARLYLYEYYIMNTSSELSNVNTLENYIDNGNYSAASNVVKDYLAGKITHKELKFKINNNAKFYKYQILSSKKLDN